MVANNFPGRQLLLPKILPQGLVSSPGPSVSPQPKPRPWGEELGACPGWLRQAPGSSCCLWRGCGSVSPVPAPNPVPCAHPKPCTATPMVCGVGLQPGLGLWEKAHSFVRLCIRQNTDLGAFLEYKGAWETSATVRDQPDKSSYEPEKCADCRALKMPGYLFLLDKADKQRTKDPGLCNLGCSSLAVILRCSQGGGGRMSSSQRQLQLLPSPRVAVERIVPALTARAGQQLTAVPGSEWPQLLSGAQLPCQQLKQCHRAPAEPCFSI